MIAKVPQKRNDARSSFRTLRDYIARKEDVDPETGEAIYEGVAIDTNCLSFRTSSAEMRAAAAMNPRVKDPVYHVVLSWREGEIPSDEQMFAAGRDAMAAVGMTDHQYVFAAHRDTDHHHLHMMVNRVHPETEKAVYPDRDYYKLDKCMREVELAQGWAHDKGPYAVYQRDGKAVIDWASAGGMETAEKASTVARDLESATGRESFFSFARKARHAVAKELGRPDSSWEELHSVLAKNGLELRVKGMGLGIFDAAHPERTPIKASDLHESLGKGKLEKRLGKFAPRVMGAAESPPLALYDPKAPAQRDRTSLEAQKLARKSARTALLERYREAKKAHGDGASELLAGIKRVQASERATALHAYKMRRAEAKRQFHDPAMRSLAGGAAKLDYVVEQLAIQERAATARKAVAFPSRDAWIGEQAVACDEAAMAYMRGLYYAEQRRAKRQAEEEAENSIRPALPSPEYGPKVGLQAFARMSYSYDKATACLIYRHDGKAAFVDRGPRMDFLPGAIQDEAIVAALHLAKAKYGTVLDLKGSPDFCTRVIKLAGRENLAIRFKDAGQEAERLASLVTLPVRPPVLARERPSRQRRGAPAAEPSSNVLGGPGVTETIAQWIHTLQVEGAPQGLEYREIGEGQTWSGKVVDVRMLEGQQISVLEVGRGLHIIIRYPGALRVGETYKGRLVDGQMLREGQKPRTQNREH